MSPVIRLRQNETVAIYELASRPTGTYYQNLVADGNAIVSTLYVDSVDPGATVRVTFEDIGLSEKPGDMITLGSHEIMTEAGSVSKTSITRFHNRPRVKVVVSGGNVTFGHWVTLKTEAISDIQFGLGKTTVFTGTTPTTGNVTIEGPGQKTIQQLSIRCAIDQNNGHRLLFSLDNTNFIKLAPGEAFSVAPRGDLTQILITSNGHEVAYEIVILTAA